MEQKVKEMEKFIRGNEPEEKSFLGSETLFRAMAEQSGEGISLADNAGNYVFINSAFCKMTGYSKAELVTMNVLDLMPPEIELSLFPKVLKNNSGKRETELMKKNGSRFMAEVSGYPIKLEEQLLVLGIVRDISQEKRIEGKLLESERKHKTLINNIPGMVYQAYSDWSAEVISGSEEICGYTNEELNSKEDNWLSLIHPDDKEDVFKQGTELTKRTQNVVQTYRIITREGDIRWVEDRKTSLFSEEGEFKGIDGIVFDITDRKKVEEDLQTSEMTARALLNASTETAFLIEKDGTYVDMNEVTAMRLGKSVKDLLGKSFMGSVPKEVAESRKRIVEQVILNRQPIRYEDERSNYIFDNNVYPVIDSDGNVNRIAVYSRDITMQKLAEKALTISEQKYKLIAENSTDVIYKVNIENEQYSYVSPSVEKIFGYSSEEILGLKPRNLHTMESYAMRCEKLEKAVLRKTNDPGVLEMQMLRKDGQVIPVEINARILFDNLGAPQEILGIARDITRRKEAESALKKSEERYKFLAENMGDVVWTVDMDLNTTYISPSVEKVLGYTPEEREKQKLEEMVTPESLDHINSIMVKELEREKLSDIDPDRSITVEVEYYRRDGTIIWMENQIKAIRNQAGEIIGLYGVSRDITDRKIAQEALIREKEKLQEAISKIKQLSGMLPICSACKKIRDDKGYWNQIESYIRDHSEAEFSHGLCPECAEKLYPDFVVDKDKTHSRISNP